MLIRQKIELFLKQHNLLNSTQNILVGFSGGYDSLCLLEVLSKLSEEHGFKIVAAHLNHNWRGEESNIEEQNCKEYCKKHNIQFYSETLSSDLPQTELEARNQRYNFFNRCIDKFKISSIITGHTKTDNIETLIYRIIKGTGLQGLKGIPEVRMLDKTPIYRPMLDISREETIGYCRDNGLKPNIDSSNQDIKYARNNIRNVLIPELERYNSDVGASLLRLSEIAKDSDEIIELCLSSIKKDLYKEEGIICTKSFIDNSNAVQKRLLMDFLTSNNIEFDYKKIQEALTFLKESSALKSGNTLSLTLNRWLFVSRDEIRIIKNIKSNVVKSSIEVDLKTETYIEGLNITFSAQNWDHQEKIRFPKENEMTALADLSGINEPLYIRTRQQGDVIQPFGMQNTIKLKKYLINKGVPEFKRDETPLLTTKDQILWVIGVGISEHIKVKDVPTHKLTIKYN